MAAKKNKRWIQGAIKHPGALRAYTHTPEGKNIPVKTLRRIAKKGGTMGRRANLALTLRKLR